jgi:hypothetical protein
MFPPGFPRFRPGDPYVCIHVAGCTGSGADPPKLTTEAAMKFVPLIVSVKAALPATVLFGEIVVIVGAGLDPLDVV